MLEYERMENIISKKLKIVGLIAGFLALFWSAFPLSVHADQSQSAVTQQIQTFQSQLNAQLSQVNQLYTKANDAQQQLEMTQGKIDRLESKIAQSQKEEASLKKVVTAQMRALQSNGGVTVSVIGVVTSSNSLSDMIQRLTNLNMVLDAESTQAKELKNTQLSLKEMKASLETSKTQLVENQQSYQTKVTNLQANVTQLQTKISSNKQLLSEMQAKAAADQVQRQKKLAAAQASVTTAAEKTVHPSSTSTTSSSSSGSSVISTGNNGRTLNVLATAYAGQDVGYITATGIDLQYEKNPKCIAVDPSVIALGSLLEVPGYGIAIAGDTGGAIIGNHIDVYFPFHTQAVNWGARNIQIKVLS